ncbi:hypothetical protein WR25_10916 [Diploscapter pachys]|uniref:Uncharacterized protein n=1 Tax=Diploscapter pachys TaxID=2018661 RepID=A0A2A2K7U3_9BILA|nr:hypothetical protein WR25_10916 [Diploscapter pachys]
MYLNYRSFLLIVYYSFLMVGVLPSFLYARGVSRRKPLFEMRAKDEPIKETPCEIPNFIEKLEPALKHRVTEIWSHIEGKEDCLIEVAKTRTILQSLPMAERARLMKSPIQCEEPYKPKFYPRKIRRRMRKLWAMPKKKNNDCWEKHRRTKLLLLNLPVTFNSFRQHSAFMCAVPHFIDRLEQDLQKQLYEIWKGYKKGQECAARVEKQLILLQKNDISLRSFQMPPPSMFRRYEIIHKLRRASFAR